MAEVSVVTLLVFREEAAGPEDAAELAMIEEVNSEPVAMEETNTSPVDLTSDRMVMREDSKTTTIWVRRCSI